MVKINGSLQEAAGMTVSEYLKSADFDTRRIVVEKNQMIIPKAEYDQTVLQDGDIVEIISFVGGG